MHGHELDTVVQNVRWLAFAGDLGYQFLLSLNPAINFFRRLFGRGYWSLSAYAKKRVKDAVNFIGEFEKAVVRYAERESVDAVLCGHIHSPAIRQIGSVTYYNCGDWVETCSALVENHDGSIELLFLPALCSRRDRTAATARTRAFSFMKLQKPKKRVARLGRGTSPTRHLAMELDELRRDLRTTLRAYAAGLEVHLAETTAAIAAVAKTRRIVARTAA